MILIILLQFALGSLEIHFNVLSLLGIPALVSFPLLRINQKCLEKNITFSPCSTTFFFLSPLLSSFPTVILPHSLESSLSSIDTPKDRKVHVSILLFHFTSLQLLHPVMFRLPLANYLILFLFFTLLTPPCRVYVEGDQGCDMDMDFGKI